MKGALATVVATRKSSPRPVGSKLVITEDGKLEGSVSGGCVESDVFVAAQEVMDTGVPRLLTYGITDDMALNVGLPCGGEIDVFVEPLRVRVAESDAREVQLTVIAGEPLGAKLVVREDGTTEGDGPPELAALAADALRRGRSHTLEQDGRTVFADVSGPPPRLFVYGAVDTAESLCAAAKLLGWSTVVADARGRFATPDRVPSADELLVAWPEEALAQQPPDTATAIFVLTHDDKFDLPMLQAAVRSDAFYIGALGSRRNQERRRELLREAGLTDEELERISGPSGLDIGAESPAETAISMLAEALAVRAGRKGGFLRDSPHRIHADVAAGKK
ncbi:MAG TPA: XdhC/CoxI family protein [Gaiellaceae bacterium]